MIYIYSYYWGVLKKTYNTSIPPENIIIVTINIPDFDIITYLEIHWLLSVAKILCCQSFDKNNQSLQLTVT